MVTDISVQGVHIGFEKGDEVLRGVTFDITSGEHVGITGRNGCGKTTLFRIITGELTPDSGSVVISQSKRVGVLSQIPIYPLGFTGEDVLIDAQKRVIDMGDRMRLLESRMSKGASDRRTLSEYDAVSAEFTRLGGYELKRFRDMVANGLGIPQIQREQAFDELSGGEQTRLNLARLLLDNTEILLLDEPTNHLDIHALEWLENYIASYKGTVLTVSHDRRFLDNAVTRIIEIENGVAENYSGAYSFYIEEKRRRYEEQLKRYEKEQAKIKQLQKAADDLHLWAFMGSDKLHKRAFSMEKRIAKMSTTEKPKTEKRVKARFGELEFNADEALVLKGVSKSFGEKKLFQNIDLLMEKSERIAIIGDNGTGKSTLLKIIMDEEQPDSGLVRIGPSVRCAYLPQSVSFEDENATVAETVMYEEHITRADALSRLAAFLFRGETVDIPVNRLSGGERSRLKLCMLMKSRVNLLILDEPTNHLDAVSREWIEDALEDYGEALLFVSHDRYFIKKLATRIWEFKDGKIYDYRCGYDRFLELSERRAAETPIEKPSVKPREPSQPREKKRGGTYTRDKELAKLNRETSTLETALSENRTLQEENGADYIKLMELTEEQERLEEKLLELYERMEELSREE